MSKCLSCLFLNHVSSIIPNHICYYLQTNIGSINHSLYSHYIVSILRFPLHICFSVNDASSHGITIYCTGQHFRPLFYPPHKSFLHFCKSKFGCLLFGLDLLSASNSCTELRSPSYSATELDPTLSPTYSPSYISSTP